MSPKWFVVPAFLLAAFASGCGRAPVTSRTALPVIPADSSTKSVRVEYPDDRATASLEAAGVHRYYFGRTAQIRGTADTVAVKDYDSIFFFHKARISIADANGIPIALSSLKPLSRSDLDLLPRLKRPLPLSRAAPIGDVCPDCSIPVTERVSLKQYRANGLVNPLKCENESSDIVGKSNCHHSTIAFTVSVKTMKGACSYQPLSDDERKQTLRFALSLKDRVLSGFVSSIKRVGVDDYDVTGSQYGPLIERPKQSSRDLSRLVLTSKLPSLSQPRLTCK
jgi:hypothetical protein